MPYNSLLWSYMYVVDTTAWHAIQQVVAIMYVYCTHNYMTCYTTACCDRLCLLYTQLPDLCCTHNHLIDAPCNSLLWSPVYCTRDRLMSYTTARVRDKFRASRNFLHSELKYLNGSYLVLDQKPCWAVLDSSMHGSKPSVNGVWVISSTVKFTRWNETRVRWWERTFVSADRPPHSRKSCSRDWLHGRYVRNDPRRSCSLNAYQSHRR